MPLSKVGWRCGKLRAVDAPVVLEDIHIHGLFLDFGGVRLFGVVGLGWRILSRAGDQKGDEG
jgi:hypothetical protein